MPPTHETEAFCLRLKAARLRRGLTLESIAEATKVCVSYYTALEANDVRRWPKGLFRRAFFRGYVTAIGLPADETTEEFARLFPEDDRAAASATAAPAEAPCRLVLDQSWHGIKTPFRSRLVHAVVDIGAIGVIAAGAWLAGLDVATTAAVTSVTYFTLATILFGESPAAWAHRWVPRSDGDAAEEPQHGSTDEDREWVSDARRVRPREDTPRLRVRFKTSP